MKLMKKLILVILITSPFLVLCQTEKEISKKISAEFEKNYNSDEYQEIFKMFSDEIKPIYQLNKLRTFSKDLIIKLVKLQVGSLSNTKTELMLPTKQLLNEQYLH